MFCFVLLAIQISRSFAGVKELTLRKDLGKGWRLEVRKFVYSHLVWTWYTEVFSNETTIHCLTSGVGRASYQWGQADSTDDLKPKLESFGVKVSFESCRQSKP